MVRSVLIADDQEVIRRMLCFLFDSQSDFEVCGEAENGQEAVEMAQVLRPDLIMLDLSMPVMNGIEAEMCIETIDAHDADYCIQRLQLCVLRT